jgi:hypothetical protein
MRLVFCFNVVFLLVLALVSLSLAACERTAMGDRFDGLNEARFSNPLTPPKQFDEKIENPLDIQNFEDKYVHTINDGRFLKAKDYLSINLKNAYFGQDFEGTGEHIVNTDFPTESHVKSEFAIAVNVVSGSSSIAQKRSSDSIPGKIVYYSEDIYAGQEASQLFMPIYGPKEYDGEPITLDITVLEIDEEERQNLGTTLSILSNLAKSYSGSIGPYASIVDDLLTNIGSKILSANQDDIIGTYVAHFIPYHPEKARHDIRANYLRTGDWVLIRKPDRDVPIDWSSIDYEPETARLVTCSDRVTTTGLKCPMDKEHKKYFGDKYNYFVFSFQKNMGATDQTPLETAQQFMAKLSAEINKTNLNVDVVEKIAKTFTQKLSRNKQFDALRVAVAKLHDKNENVRKRHAEKLVQALQCNGIFYSGVNQEPIKEDFSNLCGQSMKDFTKYTQITEEEYQYIIEEIEGTHKAVTLSNETLFGTESAALNSADTLSKRTSLINALSSASDNTPVKQ